MVETTRKGVKLSKHTMKWKESVINCEISSHTSLLPNYFNSDLSENENFLGFPSDVAELNIASAFVIKYSVSERGVLLFYGDLCDEEFYGFTKEEISLTLLPLAYLTECHKHKGKSNVYKEGIFDEDEYLCKLTLILLPGKPLIMTDQSDLNSPSYTQIYNYLVIMLSPTIFSTGVGTMRTRKAVPTHP